MPQEPLPGPSVDVMPAWNPLQVDAYDFHLAALSATNPVTASENIYSAAGQLLLAAGEVITPDAIKIFSATILRKPLAQSVSIQRVMGNADFYQYLMDTIGGTEFFQALEERKYPLESVRFVSDMLEQFPLVQQRLTVMVAQMNDLFQRTLSVGLWSIFIAQEMRLPSEQTRLIFWAAITHDFGMMHIPPELLAKQEELTTDEWRKLQSHVDISRGLLEQFSDFPEDHVMAVYEHHERCDGTGYPHGKVESEISLFGQILALADGLVGIYFNRFKPYGRRWREVIPVLELNRAAYLCRSCEIVGAMIFRSEMPLDKVVEGSEIPAFAERVAQHNQFLQQWFSALRSVLTEIGFTHGDRKLHSLQNVVLHIAATFKGSLLFNNQEQNTAAGVLLPKPSDGEQAGKSVSDAALRQQEMSFHLHRLTHMLQVYVAAGECKNPHIQKKLEQVLTEVMKKVSGFTPPTS